MVKNTFVKTLLPLGMCDLKKHPFLSEGIMLCNFFHKVSKVCPRSMLRKAIYNYQNVIQEHDA